MALASDQILSAKEWNKAIQTSVQNALGGALDGAFLAAPCPAGFNYAVKQRYYNAATLDTLDALVNVAGGIASLGGSFSMLCKEVMGNLGYGFSKADTNMINLDEAQQVPLVGRIIDAYGACGLDDAPLQYATVIYIMKRIKEVTGTDYMHVNFAQNPTFAPLCRNLSEYARIGAFTAKMENAWSIANDRINAIISHISAPSDANGGIKTDAATFRVGWDKLPETQQLLDSLRQGSSMAFSLSADSFKESACSLHFESSVNCSVPPNWLFNLSVDHEHTYDLSKYAQDRSSLGRSVAYNGVTAIAAVPSPLTNDNAKGWFAPDILNEAAANSGQDATGIQLLDKSKQNVYFGGNGQLKRLKTFVISQPPIIRLHFDKFQCSEMSKIFTRPASVRFSVLGGLISGTHRDGYRFTDYSCSDSAQTLDVTIEPAPIGSSGDISHQVAFVLGGVAETYPTNR
jgi:hypothetical protein